MGIEYEVEEEETPIPSEESESSSEESESRSPSRSPTKRRDREKRKRDRDDRHRKRRRTEIPENEICGLFMQVWSPSLYMTHYDCEYLYRESARRLPWSATTPTTLTRLRSGSFASSESSAGQENSSSSLRSESSVN